MHNAIFCYFTMKIELEVAWIETWREKVKKVRKNKRERERERERGDQSKHFYG